MLVKGDREEHCFESHDLLHHARQTSSTVPVPVLVYVPDLVPRPALGADRMKWEGLSKAVAVAAAAVAACKDEDENENEGENKRIAHLSRTAVQFAALHVLSAPRHTVLDTVPSSGTYTHLPAVHC